jgi:proteasome beta subunit
MVLAMNGNPEELKKGTTTLGIVCKEGVVMATEHRATAGTLIAHKTTQKLFKIDEHLALCVAGLVGDAQVLARYITAEVQLYRLKHNAEMTTNAAATLMSNILAGRRYFPYWVQLLMGGVDKDGGHVYSLDAAGGSIPDDYVTTGSGSPYVYGILEDYYKPDMSMNDTIDLAIRGLSAAMKRDSASGNGISVASITKKEFKELDDAEVTKRIEKMKLA